MDNKYTICGLAIFVSLCLSMAGCGKKPYAHDKLSKDSPEYKQCEKMLNDLRSDEQGDIISRQLPADIEAQHKASAIAALETIQEAENIDLIRVDQFGENVYRATLKITLDDQAKSYAMLLIKDNGKLYWVGKN